MRNPIAHALTWLLCLLVPARGRHRAPAKTTQPASVVICAPRTPIPMHVLTRTMPTPKPLRIPPYLQEWIAVQEAEWDRQRQRRVSAVAAALGYEVPFTFDGTDVTRVEVIA